MSEAGKQKRRVVSKWRYAGHLGAKAALRSVGIVLSVISVIVGAFISFVVLDYFYPTLIYNQESPGSGVAMMLTLAVFGTICLGAWWLIMPLFRKASNMEPVVPLTRNTAANLPEPESLVRASTEPTQEQKDILLRGAQPGSQTAPAELLRAGQQEERTE